MKKLILIVLIFSLSYNADAVIRVKLMAQLTNEITVQNYASFAYSYDQFQMSVNSQLYTLSAVLSTGTLTNMAAGATAVLSIPLPPESLVGASISIWYPNSIPGNATVNNLVDFLQYGSAGNAYETVAVQAGTWTVGAFISTPFPIEFTGGILDFGTSFYGTFVGIDNPSAENNIGLYPNPCIDNTTLYIPIEFSANNNTSLEVYNAIGKLVDDIKITSELFYELNTEFYKKGMYYVKIKNAAEHQKTLKLVRH